MTRDHTGERKNKLEELAKLKHAALAELERRGYEVRGKNAQSNQKNVKTASEKTTPRINAIAFFRALSCCGLADRRCRYWHKADIGTS